MSAVYDIVRHLLGKGITPSSIGIIALYKAQMYKIQHKLQSIQLAGIAAQHNTTSHLSPVKQSIHLIDESSIASNTKRQSGRSAAKLIQISTVDAFQVRVVMYDIYILTISSLFMY